MSHEAEIAIAEERGHEDMLMQLKAWAIAEHPKRPQRAAVVGDFFRWIAEQHEKHAEALENIAKQRDGRSDPYLRWRSRLPGGFKVYD